MKWSSWRTVSILGVHFGLLLELSACNTPSGATSFDRTLTPTIHTADSTPTVIASTTSVLTAHSPEPLDSASATAQPTMASQSPTVPLFDGQRAYADVLAQMAFGPRPSGSAANRQTGDYILEQLQAASWTTGEQKFQYHGVEIRNITGHRGTGPAVIVGAHYDTRRRADQDPKNPAQPVPGANDGASGVAVLLELARTLNISQAPYTVWLAFFDAEDNGDLDGWEWTIGSRYLADHWTPPQPQFVIVLDMVGDADLQLYQERNSTPAVRDPIWATADALGYGSTFIRREKWSMMDDHTPFLQNNIPAVDIIDFDYPPWHTTQDTADKVSATSLEAVGRTVAAFLQGAALRP